MTARKVEAEEPVDDETLDESEHDALLIESAMEGYDEADDDDIVDIDLSEAVSYAPFTATVPVQIVKAVKKHGKTSKAPYIDLQLVVIEGEYAKRVLFLNINLTGKGAGFGIDKLHSFGADLGSDPKRPQISIKSLFGCKALVEVAPDDRPEYAHKCVVGKVRRYVSPDVLGSSDLK